MKAVSADKSRTWIIHPFLFAVLPILDLYYQNITLGSPRLLPRPMLVTLAATLALFLLLRSILRDSIKCGLLVSALLFFVFNYAPIGMALYRAIRISIPLFLACWIAFFLAFTIVIGLSRRPWRKTNLFLNAFTILSVAILLFSIVRFEWRQGRMDIPRFPGDLAPLSGQPDTAENRETRPDIYYIIVDAYGRDDVLHDVYFLDNGAFLRFLESKGFFIARDSRSNYSQTMFSLASSLNMRYLHSLAEVVGTGSMNRRPLMRMIHDSDLACFLKRRGYLVTSFDSLYSSVSVRNSDPARKCRPGLTDFEITLLNQTLLRIHFHAAGYRAHIHQILSTLDELGKLPSSGSPRLVFAHVVCPHPPFVFAQDGGSRIPSMPFAFNDGNHYIHSRPSLVSYLNGYRGQVLFMNRRLEVLVGAILRNSRTPPVIVLQGDHGPGSRLSHDHMEHTDLRERLAILNAILLPATGRSRLYAGISPVNTFRVILNECFGARLPLLADQAYFLNWNRPYSPVLVDEECLRRREP
jgi:hypothetical protein